ncbi:hypothetical protein H2200_008332 [Cladophialophora chaetospira]|uniref:Uncharacterized protein n=1 Tax=Cladophialophora chaetospira TaxID=386627 RepID=A0AA38X5Z3_9EURO|nr:hypothetical protein H2200_008332 [Cladophialophora chaetospira]
MSSFSSIALVAFSFYSIPIHAVPWASPIVRGINTTFPATSAANSTGAVSTAANSTALDATVLDCKLQLPANALTAEGLSTPWLLLPPCSQAVATQQAFAEAAIIDPQGQLSVYHPLVIDQGKKPQVAPVVPNIAAGSQVILFFGFNGNTLTLVDSIGKDSNASPVLKNLKCVNGLPGVQGDVFGQVSWCNTVAFWGAVNTAVAHGQLKVPPLGTNNNRTPCLSSHSFAMIDQDQSDNLPTKYLLLSDGSTVQFTAANVAKFPTATEIDNASDEALLADFINPVIGCTSFAIPSLDDPGTMVPTMASQELQALLDQTAPAALIPLNDPDTLLTANGQMSPEKTNAYRLGINMAPLGTGPNTDDGSPTNYCNNLIAIQPPFLASFQTGLTAATTPDDTVGNNLFTFLANRFLMSLTNLNCPNKNIPVTCTLDGNGVATACSITATISTGNGTTISQPAGGTGTNGTGAGGKTASDLASTAPFSMTALPSHHTRHGFGEHSASAGTHTVVGNPSIASVDSATASAVAVSVPSPGAQGNQKMPGVITTFATSTVTVAASTVTLAASTVTVFESCSFITA